YSRSSFNPQSTTIGDDYHKTYNNIVKNDLPSFKTLTLSLATDQERPALEQNLRNFQTNLEAGASDFDRSFELVSALTDPNKGQLVVLTKQGDALQKLTAEANNADLNSKMAQVRGLEFAMVQTGSKQAQL